MWALRRRSVNQIDRWDSTTYRRTVFVDDALAELGITQVGKMERPRLHVSVTGSVSRASHKVLREIVNRMLGLNIDLAPFYEIAAQHSLKQPCDSIPWYATATLPHHLRGVGERRCMPTTQP